MLVVLSTFSLNLKISVKMRKTIFAYMKEEVNGCKLQRDFQSGTFVYHLYFTELSILVY